MRFSLSAPRSALLEQYVLELQRWGGRVNLVASTRLDAIQPHLDDSLAAAEHLPEGVRVVDLGSGAGFPGIPLVIARPDLAVTLVEIRERRVHFLRHVVRQLGLSCRIERARIEVPPVERFDFALAKAVGAPQGVVRLAAPWVRPGGEIWIWSRIRPEDLGVDGVGEIPLGERGRILRVPVAEGPPRMP